jgi:hypothetical protein
MRRLLPLFLLVSAIPAFGQTQTVPAPQSLSCLTGLSTWWIECSHSGLLAAMREAVREGKSKNGALK